MLVTLPAELVTFTVILALFWTSASVAVVKEGEFVPTFIPFMYLFAAAIKVQWGEPGPGRMRTPLGRLAATSVCSLGLLTTTISMGLAVLPPTDEPDKGLYVVKVVGLAVLLLGAGGLVYLLGKRQPTTPLTSEAA